MADIRMLLSDKAIARLPAPKDGWCTCRWNDLRPDNRPVEEWRAFLVYHLTEPASGPDDYSHDNHQTCSRAYGFALSIGI